MNDTKNILISVISALILSVMLLYVGFLDRSQLLMHDKIQKYWGERADYSDILVIDIDETSLQSLRSQLGSWPYDRHIFANLTKYLADAGVQQIVFDILFSDGRAGDREFINEMVTTKANVHLAAILLHDYIIDDQKQKQLLQEKYLKVENPPDIRIKGAVFPNDDLLKSSQVGLISIIPDIDGVVRDVPLIFNIDNHYLPAMALSVLTGDSKSPVKFDWQHNLASTDTHQWPVNSKGAVTIKYPANIRAMPVIPFYKVILGMLGDNIQGVDIEYFRNKTVFIGSTATVLGDYTYIPNQGRIYGLGLLAQIFHSLKHNKILVEYSSLLNIVACFPWIIILGGQILLSGLRPVALYIGYVLAFALAAVIVVSSYTMAYTQVWLVFPAVAALLFVVITTFIKTLSLQIDKARLNLENIAAEESRILREKYLRFHDLLTELPNREYFIEQISQAIHEAEHTSKSMAIFIVDLDRFKTINDSLGPEVGDKVIMAIAKRLRRDVTQSVILARLGGDEFAIALLSLLATNEHELSMLSQKLLRIVSEPIQVDTYKLHVTASIGISCYPADGTSAAVLMQHADTAMYRAKELGSNNYRFYSAEMSAKDLQILQLENDLRGALERDEFVLYYQPKISLDTGNIVGAEALIRWHHPTMGILQPSKFISLLEDTGLIIPVGEWIITSACKQLLVLSGQGISDFSIAVNVSAKQFNSDIFVKYACEQAELSGINPENIELEITENILMGNVKNALSSIEALKAFGFMIAIDDFGTGYSSLSYLQQFKVDVLKIDQSFVANIPGDQDMAAITTAIIAMASSLQLLVVAEGIERKEQLDFLRAQGCQVGQGFYFSKPIPADELLELTLRPTLW